MYGALIAYRRLGLPSLSPNSIRRTTMRCFSSGKDSRFETTVMFEPAG